MTSYSLTHLRGRALEASYDRVASDGARTTALQLAHLAELEHQGYHLDAGYSSMFRFCVSRKGLSEDVAVQWIRAARAGREHPGVFEAIAEGRLNVTAVCRLSKHLTAENTAELIAAAERKSIKQVVLLIAERFGRRTRLDSPRAAVDNSLTVPVSIRVAENAVSPESGEEAPATLQVASDAAGNSSPDSLRSDPAGDSVPPRRARIEPIGPGLFELVAVLGQEAYDQLEASRELLGHAVPSGALIEVLERAIALQHQHLLKRRTGATDRPRTSANGATPRANANPRQIPAAVERAVWERDDSQCAFVGDDGHRCEERFKIELDHIVPVARGGQSTEENLRLLCEPHHRLVTEREFGKEHVKAKRETAQRHRAAERFHKQAERERLEKRKAEIERQREELGGAFKSLGYTGRDLEIALAYCASRAEAPLEERFKYTLSCMAPNARKESPPPASAA